MRKTCEESLNLGDFYWGIDTLFIAAYKVMFSGQGQSALKLDLSARGGLGFGMSDESDNDGVIVQCA
jgi:hypothetical protein